MSKRRGFTLTEIVVVIALTSLVLAMVGGCLYFVSTYSGTLISKSEELTKVQTIETYLRGQVSIDGENNNKYITNYSDLLKLQIIHGDLVICKVDETFETIIKNTGFSNLSLELFYIKDGARYEYNEITESTNEYFLECQLFKEGSTDPDYTFILGIVNE